MTENLRPDYYDTPPAEDFLTAPDPFSLFKVWFEDAGANELNDANAMTLATVDSDGLPNVRVVLLKDFDRSGFVFFTNYESVKGQEILGQRKAALCFHWKSLRRQVRLRGPVEAVSADEADAYFASRPRGSRIGAWASHQSRPLANRAELEEAVARYEEMYPGEDIPRPPHWSGFRVLPLEIEFWHDRPFRLHDRIVFKRQSPDADWTRMGLYP